MLNSRNWVRAALAGLVSVASVAVASEVVPVRFVDGVPMIDVTLGALRSEFELDTGGQIGVTIPPPLIVPAAGVTLQDKFSKMSDAAGHVIDVQALTAADVKIGAVSLGSVDGHVNYQWGLSIGNDHAAPHRNNGVIGLGALSGRKLLFDLGAGRLVLLENDADVPTDLANWLKVPVRYGRDGLVVDLDVGDGSAAMVLDTGATGSAVRRDAKIFAKNAPCRRLPPSAGFCGVVPLRRLRMSGHPIRDVSVAVVAMDGVPFDGVLGVDFFKAYRVLVDFDSSVLYLNSYKPR